MLPHLVALIATEQFSPPPPAKSNDYVTPTSVGPPPPSLSPVLTRRGDSNGLRSETRRWE